MTDTKTSEALKATGLTAKELSIKLDASTRLVYYWISGERIPKGRNLLKVSNFTGVSINDLIE